MRPGADKLRPVPVRYDYVRLDKGCDEVTPNLSLPPGTLRESLNVELSITGGLRRIDGFERFDGRPLPSSASFYATPITLTGSISIGATVVGGTSGVSETVLFIYGGVLYTSALTAGFISTEEVKVGGVTQATTTAASTAGSATTAYLTAQAKGAAADVARALINPVPGSGPVRGVCMLGNVVYAWRDNVGATSCDIYKATVGGWVNVPYKAEIKFNTGVLLPAEGQTLKGTTSGATAVLRRIVTQSGSWGTTAAGKFIVDTVVGVFVAGETIKSSIDAYGAVRATSASTATGTTAPAGGRYEFDVYNFGGTTAQKRIYGVSGVSRGFEFDGTTYVPLDTGMAVDTPNHVSAYANCLVLSFGASVQYSGVGSPYAYTPLLGAGEIGMGSDVSGFLVQPGSASGGALLIFTQDFIKVLYSTPGSASSQLVPYSQGIGGYPASMQNLLNGYYIDDHGVQSISTSQNYGNFEQSVISFQIQNTLNLHKSRTWASSLNFEKSQYRVFFSDNFALYFTIVNGEPKGAMPIQFPIPVYSIWTDKNALGEGVSYFGSDTGYVYKLDSGTSFDGEPISFSGKLGFLSQKSPRVLKRYRRLSVEAQAGSYAEVSIGYSLGYNTTEIDVPADQVQVFSSNPPSWDSFTWDLFSWDGTQDGPVEVGMEGTGENVEIRFAGSSAIFSSFTLTSLIIHYSSRRSLR